MYVLDSERLTHGEWFLCRHWLTTPVAEPKHFLTYQVMGYEEEIQKKCRDL